MSQHLVLTVHLHDRFHGLAEGGSEWPPAPGRLFQALVAGNARGRTLPDDTRAALEWLESLPAPVIGAPHARLGERVVLFVPNNDGDSLGDLRDVGSIRTRKIVQPRIPAPGPLLYAWPIEADPYGRAARVVRAADDIYQLGRGVDMAWAYGEILSEDEFVERLSRFDGEVYRPGGGRFAALACPARGTLRSLERRHTASRLTVEGTGRKARTYFTNAPKPFFVRVAYAPDIQRLVFELRRSEALEKPAPEVSSRVVQLVEQIRDAAVTRLVTAMPEHEEAITACLVGRRPGDAAAGKPEHRVRIVPLPSIGHVHADRGVRRVLIEIPSGAPLRAADVVWAFNGLDVVDHTTGHIRMVLTPSATPDMLRRHYLPKARRWRSVTPLAVPAMASRRRIEPTRRELEAKGGAERAEEEMTAVRAVVTALRHAGIQARPSSVRVQREPFDLKGQRAEAFEHKPRFPKERLWHVEITFGRPIEGPLVLGDGRFLGLGLMAPVRDAVPGIHAFTVTGGLVGMPAPTDVARALRRAVMSRVQDTLGTREQLAPFFTGHADDGSPIARSRSAHLLFSFDPDARRLLVLAPHVVERRAPTNEELRHLGTLSTALEGLDDLRAGSAGRLRLLSEVIDEDSGGPIFANSQVWESLTTYVVTRHAKGGEAAEALAADLRAECRRHGLPEPIVDVRRFRGVAGLGLTGDVRLTFGHRVAGPILLGRTRHLGGGLFRAVREAP